ncbi:hypothetical protein PCL_07022 [Purpureocillium lilacinum]|uniref:Uncharacterized protein n=1 Tax=Purpureocillium lilacinum TaxID=33203 RepID=A0A2U3DT27_PURLI|nr:hypothetical protein PCL_07022 [Purpureocillium lilacinum]
MEVDQARKRSDLATLARGQGEVVDAVTRCTSLDHREEPSLKWDLPGGRYMYGQATSVRYHDCRMQTRRQSFWPISPRACFDDADGPALHTKYVEVELGRSCGALARRQTETLAPQSELLQFKQWCGISKSRRGASEGACRLRSRWSDLIVPSAQQTQTTRYLDANTSSCAPLRPDPGTKGPREVDDWQTGSYAEDSACMACEAQGAALLDPPSIPPPYIGMVTGIEMQGLRAFGSCALNFPSGPSRAVIHQDKTPTRYEGSSDKEPGTIWISVHDSRRYLTSGGWSSCAIAIWTRSMRNTENRLNGSQSTQRHLSHLSATVGSCDMEALLGFGQGAQKALYRHPGVE